MLLICKQFRDMGKSGSQSPTCRWSLVPILQTWQLGLDYWLAKGRRRKRRSWCSHKLLMKPKGWRGSSQYFLKFNLKMIKEARSKISHKHLHKLSQNQAKSPFSDPCRAQRTSQQALVHPKAVQLLRLAILIIFNQTQTAVQLLLLSQIFN